MAKNEKNLTSGVDYTPKTREDLEREDLEREDLEPSPLDGADWDSPDLRYRLPRRELMRVMERGYEPEREYAHPSGKRIAERTDHMNKMLKIIGEKKIYGEE